MARYHINTAGSNTPPYNTFATGATDPQTVFDLWGPTDDVIYMLNTSDFSFAGAITLTCAGGTEINRPIIRCTDVSYNFVKSSSPNITSTTASGDIAMAGSFVWQGVMFDVDDDLNFTTNDKNNTLEDLVLHVDDRIDIGSTSESTKSVNFKNVDLTWHGVGGKMLLTGADLTWRGGSVTMAVLANQPMFIPSPVRNSSAWLENVDFSGCPDNIELVNITGNAPCSIIFNNCIMPIGYTLVNQFLTEDQVIKVIKSDDAGNDYVTTIETLRGVIDDEIGIYLTAGAVFNGVTNYALRMTPSPDVSADPVIAHSFIAGGIGFIFEDALDTATTFTIELLENYTIGLTDKNCWIELSYPDNSSETHLSLISSQSLDGTGAGTTLTTSVEAWTGTLTGYTKRSISITTNGTTIPHPQKNGLCKAVIKLGVYEAGKDIIYNPQVTVTQ